MSAAVFDVTAVIRELIEHHHAELDKLRDENRRLAKENESLWADVHDRDDKITTLQQMLERVHTTEDA
ncbi:MAG: hypothetical protein H0U66_01945 [Gemmatimonadaceae bacterium]|nr:hypothetical protein [Gemmatimonadaceae bacterium]